MSEAAKHTPTPWHVVNGNRIKDELMPFDRDERDTALITTVSGHGDCESDKANAAFIVKAVNSHEMLVEALCDAVRPYGVFDVAISSCAASTVGDFLELKSRVRAALAAAGSQ
jgi:hypothetical protein